MSNKYSDQSKITPEEIEKISSTNAPVERESKSQDADRHEKQPHIKPSL